MINIIVLIFCGYLVIGAVSGGILCTPSYSQEPKPNGFAVMAFWPIFLLFIGLWMLKHLYIEIESMIHYESIKKEILITIEWLYSCLRD